MSEIAYQDGELLPPERLAVGPADAGLLHGDGLFETLLVAEGRAVDPEAHLDRLLAGVEAVAIRLPEERSQLQAALESVAASAPRPWARLRMVVTRGAPDRGPTRLITAVTVERPSLQQRRDGVRLVPVDPPVRRDDPQRRLKSTSYQASILAARAAWARGGYEALLCNDAGRVAEGSRCNVLVRLDDRVITPPIDEGCLPGTVRRRLIESAAVEEAPVTFEQLLGADEILLTGSIVGVLPVGRVEERRLVPGPAGVALSRIWEETWVGR